MVTQAEGRRRIRRVAAIVGLLGLLALAMVGAGVVVRFVAQRVLRAGVGLGGLSSMKGDHRGKIPASRMPGPLRDWGALSFVLDATNSVRMTGSDWRSRERWCDVAGNFYSEKFVSGFSHEREDDNGPLVRVRVEPEGRTFSGRLEAHGLKPNFAYQMKLNGVFAYRETFEAIGRVGRWLLPVGGTNFSDRDYEDYADKEGVDAYLLFDFFITDAEGNAVREFALDSSLHVLFNASRQAHNAEIADLVPAIVRADDKNVYALPKQRTVVELLWAEREHARYSSASQIIGLPPGRHRAALTLTEESFHSTDNDGGFWATVWRCPVEFVVTVSK